MRLVSSMIALCIFVVYSFASVQAAQNEVLIGSGAFGRVFATIDERSGAFHAIKEMEIVKGAISMEQSISNEIIAMQSISKIANQNSFVPCLGYYNDAGRNLVFIRMPLIQFDVHVFEQYLRAIKLEQMVSSSSGGAKRVVKPEIHSPSKAGIKGTAVVKSPLSKSPGLSPRSLNKPEHLESKVCDEACGRASLEAHKKSPSLQLETDSRMNEDAEYERIENVDGNLSPKSKRLVSKKRALMSADKESNKVESPCLGKRYSSPDHRKAVAALDHSSPAVPKSPAKVYQPCNLDILKGRVYDLFEFRSLPYFVESNGINHERLADLCRQLLTGLYLLHSKLGLVHRDIKPENILLSNTRTIDSTMPFGISYLLCDLGVVSSRGQVCIPAGTQGFLAPEVQARLHQRATHMVSSKSDIWSLGRTVMWLLPDCDLESVGKYDPIQYLQYKFGRMLAPVCLDFMMKCLESDPNRRLSASELLQHPFLQ